MPRQPVQQPHAPRRQAPRRQPARRSARQPARVPVRNAGTRRPPYQPPQGSPPVRGHHPPAHPQARRRPSRWNTNTFIMLGFGSAAALVGLCLCVFLTGIGVFYASGDVLPQVSAAGVDVGGLSEAEAATALQQAWNANGILLRDGGRTWRVTPAEIGITLDAQTTAAQAVSWGRDNGGFTGLLRGITGSVEVEPVLQVNLGQASTYLTNSHALLSLEPVNAGVRLVNGQAVARPAENGRLLDVAATVERLRVDAAEELADGALDLVMRQSAPTITDATPLVAQANALLTSPFTVKGYDPVRDEWHTWTAPPDVWAAWLEADSASTGGLMLSLNTAGPRTFLEANGTFTDERYLKLDEAVRDMQAALAQQRTSATVRVWHGETSYTVRAGQTLAAIAEEIGIPYPYIQAVNPGIDTDALMINQALKIPSRDILLPLNPVPHKRIVISRSQQHLWAYENGQVKFDWVISTGIPSSPTALGIFQVQSHDINAYADQWNLYMPHFMGFYHPGPNMDLWNGFHGFPTRGGGYLLWTGDLGRPVTYGCVLLSLENAEALYNWAEEGVVVEVRG